MAQHARQHPAQQTRTLFLRLVAFIFFLALASLYVQWDGLFGMDGIEPALKTINQKHHDNKKNNQESNLLLQLFLSNFPTLLTLHTSMGLTIDLCAEFFMVIGMALSLLATLFPKNFAIFPVLFSIQWIYLSFYLVGGTFLSFQWDILLLETGWLAIAWSPWSPFFLGKESYTSNAAIQWLLQFALFKLMFQSGVVKIQANCPTWLGLTALDFHYATQCLPTPLAWYAHQLPPLVQQLSVAITLLIEIPGAFLLISPFRVGRLFGIFLQCVLQCMIMLTGNYNYFNLLTIVLCDDQALSTASCGMYTAVKTKKKTNGW